MPNYAYKADELIKWTPKRLHADREAFHQLRALAEQADAELERLRAERDEAVSALRVKSEPLPVTDAVPHAIEVPGYGWVDIRAVRAVERAHGIGA